MVNGKASGSISVRLTMPLTLKVIAESGVKDADDDDGCEHMGMMMLMRMAMAITKLA